MNSEWPRNRAHKKNPMIVNTLLSHCQSSEPNDASFVDKRSINSGIFDEHLAWVCINQKKDQESTDGSHRRSNDEPTRCRLYPLVQALSSCMHIVSLKG